MPTDPNYSSGVHRLTSEQARELWSRSQPADPKKNLHPPLAKKYSHLCTLRSVGQGWQWCGRDELTTVLGD